MKKNKSVFVGRLSRSFFGMGYLMNLLFTVVLAVFFTATVQSYPPLLLLLPLTIFGLSIFFQISMIVRRFHDLNKSGLFALLFFIPGLGIFVLIYLFAFKGTGIANEYGEPINEEKEFFLKKVYLG